VIEIDASQLREALKDMVSRVEESVSEGVLRTVGFTGAEIFRDQAKQNSLAHKKTGVLYNSIIVKRIVEDSDGGKRQVYLVTVRSGRFGGDDAFYWRFVEDGHKFVPRNKKISKKTGRTIGWKAHRKAAELEYGTSSAPAYPFMRPAYESKKSEVIDAMTRTLAEQIARNSR